MNARIVRTSKKAPDFAETAIWLLPLNNIMSQIPLVADHRALLFSKALFAQVVQVPNLQGMY